MRTLITKIARRARIALAGDSVRYGDLTLPARHYRPCGLEFRDDAYFVASAEGEVDRLVANFGLTPHSHLLDVGCGVGRLAIGLLRRFGQAHHYRGIDVNKTYIDWCNAHIARRHPGFQFTRIDVHNPRYNPSSSGIDDSFRLPFVGHEFDVIYLYSVFSHMLAEDARVYLREFDRVLKPSGAIFLTGFIEENVPDVEENPPNYRMAWQGHLHCVRYNKAFFERLLAASGFAIDRFEYEREANGQSGLYISRAGASS
jgi:ubiquinone/menaquinone biosynthesis C-methylase UbiE